MIMAGCPRADRNWRRPFGEKSLQFGVRFRRRHDFERDQQVIGAGDFLEAANRFLVAGIEIGVKFLASR
jgi:hypothetical protein